MKDETKRLIGLLWASKGHTGKEHMLRLLA